MSGRKRPYTFPDAPVLTEHLEAQYNPKCHVCGYSLASFIKNPFDSDCYEYDDCGWYDKDKSFFESNWYIMKYYAKQWSEE